MDSDSEREKVADAHVHWSQEMVGLRIICPASLPVAADALALLLDRAAQLVRETDPAAVTLSGPYYDEADDEWVLGMVLALDDDKALDLRHRAALASPAPLPPLSSSSPPESASDG